MIKKEELRLGSLVLYIEAFSYGEEYELYVDELSDEGLVLANEHARYLGIKWEDVHPLQLFYWHLEHAGFGKKEKDVYVMGEWEVDCMKDIATWKNEHRFKVKFVHHLQNLLMAVSGIDLDFRKLI